MCRSVKPTHSTKSCLHESHEQQCDLTWPQVTDNRSIGSCGSFCYRSIWSLVVLAQSVLMHEGLCDTLMHDSLSIANGGQSLLHGQVSLRTCRSHCPQRHMRNHVVQGTKSCTMLFQCFVSYGCIMKHILLSALPQGLLLSVAFCICAHADSCPL